MKMQQRKDRLVSRLYYISSGLLALFSIYSVLTIGFDIFQKNQHRHLPFMPNHITGYTMPVKINVNTFDTLVKFEHAKYGQGGMYIKNGDSEGIKRAEVDSILTSTVHKKVLIRQEKQVHSNKTFNVNVGLIDMASAPAEGYILVKPNKTGLATLLAMRNYATLALIIFVLYQLTRLFKRLKSNFIFDGSLSRSTWLIGNSLLLYQLLLFITGLMVEDYIKTVNISETLNGVYSHKQMMTLSVDFGGNFTMLFTGLALVVLSKLLKQGYELQQENDLTI